MGRGRRCGRGAAGAAWRRTGARRAKASRGRSEPEVEAEGCGGSARESVESVCGSERRSSTDGDPVRGYLTRNPQIGRPAFRDRLEPP